MAATRVAPLLSVLVLLSWLHLLVARVARVSKITVLVAAGLVVIVFSAEEVSPRVVNQVGRLEAAQLAVAVAVAAARQTVAPAAVPVVMYRQLRHLLRQLILMLLVVVALAGGRPLPQVLAALAEAA
jgi:hypothetical protein